METTADNDSVTLNDILSLASWSRPRTTAELRAFVNRHDEALDVEGFDIDL